MLGGGVIEENWAGHCEVSAETRGCSLLSVEVGARRDIECIEEMEGRERRVERMLAPWWNSQFKVSDTNGAWIRTTRPVEPMMAVDVIIPDVNRVSIVCTD